MVIEMMDMGTDVRDGSVSMINPMVLNMRASQGGGATGGGGGGDVGGGGSAGAGAGGVSPSRDGGARSSMMRSSYKWQDGNGSVGRGVKSGRGRGAGRRASRRPSAGNGTSVAGGMPDLSGEPERDIIQRIREAAVDAVVATDDSGDHSTATTTAVANAPLGEPSTVPVMSATLDMPTPQHAVREKLATVSSAAKIEDWICIWREEKRIAKGLKGACKALNLGKLVVTEWLNSATLLETVPLEMGHGSASQLNMPSNGSNVMLEEVVSSPLWSRQRKTVVNTELDFGNLSTQGQARDRL